MGISLEPFALERWMTTYETRVSHDIQAPDVHSLPIVRVPPRGQGAFGRVLKMEPDPRARIVDPPGTTCTTPFLNATATWSLGASATAATG